VQQPSRDLSHAEDLPALRSRDDALEGPDEFRRLRDSHVRARHATDAEQRQQPGLKNMWHQQPGWKNGAIPQIPSGSTSMSRFTRPISAASKVTSRPFGMIGRGPRVVGALHVFRMSLSSDGSSRTTITSWSSPRQMRRRAGTYGG
jgi:hypothetical protein